MIPVAKAIKMAGGLLLGACFLLSSLQVHHYRAHLPAEQLRAEALMVDPTLLRILSGEFKGLMADYLNLKAAVFKGGAYQTTRDDWQAMQTLFKQSIVLDPYFFHTAYYTQGMMASREGMHEKAIEILSINAKHRDWDWEPKFFLGFDYFYYLKDNEKGARYLHEASQLPGAPPITATLAARLMQRSGQTLTAIAFLKTMLERAEDEVTKGMLANRLATLLGLHQLEQARDAYINQFGIRPSSLDELIEKGFIEKNSERAIPQGYTYDRETGEIHSKDRTPARSVKPMPVK